MSTALVIGGSLGGLLAANLLRLNGWKVQVFERVGDDLASRGAGIGTLIHYPLPPHHQQAYGEWRERYYPLTEAIHREVLSIPVSPVMREAEVDAVIAACNAWPGQ